MTPLILRFPLSPGDVLCGTAALRDLHASWPGRFLTGVQSSCPDLWEYNPNVMPVYGVEPIVMHYPLVHTSNSHRYHFITAYRAFLSEDLGLPIMQGPLRPDLHLSGEERERPPVIEGPYWIVNSGSKNDFTCKQWPVSRYQKVVEALPHLRFVQVGELSPGHRHEPLRGVTDLRGKTTLRELMLLTKHAQGAVCGVTLQMHLCAALEKPCVVVAGGREPPSWEAYNGHHYLSTMNLPCCERKGVAGGCWRSRVAALGDGTYHDQPDRLCVDVVEGHPRCMEMITAETVVAAIQHACSLRSSSLPFSRYCWPSCR